MITSVYGSGQLKSFVTIAGCLILGACNSSGSGTDGTLSSAATPAPQAAQETASLEDRSQDLRAYCPRTAIRDGTEIYRTFEKGVKKGDPDALKSLKFQSTITEVARECNYTSTSLGMKVGIKGRVINGPTGATGTLNVPVRVAITNPTSKEVIYSQLHQVPVTLSDGLNQSVFSFVDSQINLPVPERDSLIVYVGFDEGPPPS